MLWIHNNNYADPETDRTDKNCNKKRILKIPSTFFLNFMQHLKIEQKTMIIQKNVIEICNRYLNN